MRVRGRFSTLSLLMPPALLATLVLSGTSAQASTPWHRVANLPHFRSDFQAATGSDGKIYAIGGCFTGSCGSPEFTNTIDVYTRHPTRGPGSRRTSPAAAAISRLRAMTTATSTCWADRRTPGVHTTR
jgi:hypothetical protein